MVNSTNSFTRKTGITNYRELWTCKMWVVWRVLKLLYDLVVDKIGSTRGITTIQKIDTNIGKKHNFAN